MPNDQTERDDCSGRNNAFKLLNMYEPSAFSISKRVTQFGLLIELNVEKGCCVNVNYHTDWHF